MTPSTDLYGPRRRRREKADTPPAWWLNARVEPASWAPPGAAPEIDDQPARTPSGDR